MLKAILYVGLGSFLGGAARYSVSLLAARICQSPGVWATFAANIAGCLLIGIFYGLFERHQLSGENLRLFLTVGFCGGFTTFSTFINENYAHLSQGRFMQAAIYAALSLFIGLVALYLGFKITKT